MDQWASEKEATLRLLKVLKYCHLTDAGKHYIRAKFKF